MERKLSSAEFMSENSPVRRDELSLTPLQLQLFMTLSAIPLTLPEIAKAIYNGDSESQQDAAYALLHRTNVIMGGLIRLENHHYLTQRLWIERHFPSESKPHSR